MKVLLVTFSDNADHLSGKRVNRFWLSAIDAAHELGYEFHLACNMEEAEHPVWERECKKLSIITHQIDFNRNPLNPRNLRAAKQLTEFLSCEGFDIVHCNTPVGGLIGRICAKKAKSPRIIYQAHGFHFWKGAPLHNWLVYYPVERWMAHKTDVLITINKEDYKRAQSFKAKKVVYIPGVGVDTEMFCKRTEEKKSLRKELGIPTDSMVLLSVGELIKRKNHRIVIEALQNLDNIWYVICGQGPLLDDYRELSKKLGISNRVVLAGYRTDVKDFYDMADVFVLPSYQEGLSVALMEAMAAGLPCVVSDIRGNADLIEDEEWRFHPDDKDRLISIFQKRILDRSILTDEGLKNRKKAEQFRTENIVSELKAIYSDCSER